MQAWVSPTDASLQVPPPQTRSVQVRDWVPLVAHSSAKPPQAPHPGHDRLPQLAPSVLGREQAPDSVDVDSTHMPDAQR